MFMSRISTTVLAGAITAIIALGAPQSAIAQSVSCTPVQVADFPGSRIHILCAPGTGAGNIVYFALGVSDANEANRVLSLAASALVANRKLLIYFNANDLSGSAFGCQNADCRAILGIELF